MLHEVEVDVRVGVGQELGGVGDGEADVGEAVGWEVAFGYVDVIFLFCILISVYM